MAINTNIVSELILKPICLINEQKIMDIHHGIILERKLSFFIIRIMLKMIDEYDEIVVILDA